MAGSEGGRLVTALCGSLAEKMAALRLVQQHLAVDTPHEVRMQVAWAMKYDVKPSEWWLHPERPYPWVESSVELPAA